MEDSTELKLPPPKYKWGEVKDEEIKVFERQNGKKMEYIEVDGIRVSKSFIESGMMPDIRVNLPKLRQMKARDDDILICAYPKAGTKFVSSGRICYFSDFATTYMEVKEDMGKKNNSFLTGTHWMWEITKMLMKGEAKYEQLHKVSGMLEFNTPEEFDAMTSPRVFNTHLRFHQIPQQMIKKKCKLIFVQRNPKDVIVSFFHHHKVFACGQSTITFEEYLNEFSSRQGVSTYGTWYDYTLNWEKALGDNPSLNVILIYYEDLKKDPVKEISRLAEFFQVENNKQLMNEIADKCNFQNMKKAVNDKTGFHGDKESKGMTKALYRKGEVGDWKNYFTVAMNEQFDAEYKEKMKESKFKYTFTLI